MSEDMRGQGRETGGEAARVDEGAHPAGAPMDRREALKAMGVGAGALGGAYAVPAPLLERFLRALSEGTYQARFFDAAALETARVLADMIIPADERTGGATDAGTVDYMDFVLSESDERTQAQWKAGFAWLDAQARERSGAGRFADAPADVRGQVLDLVAWPEGAEERHREQVQWFNRARDLVGSGFFSSRMGVEDLRYVGGTVNPVWSGAPPEALEELGLPSYEAWDRRYGSAP